MFNTKIKYYYFIPIIIFIAVVPLIVFLKIIPLDASIVGYWTGQTENYDYFSYYKSFWILISAGLALISLLLALLLKKTSINRNFIYIPAGIYTFFVIVSALTAEFKGLALWGAPDRYEGLLVLLAYLLISFVIINLIKQKQHLRLLINFLIASASIIGIIGILQYFGYNIFDTLLGKLFILPQEEFDLAEQMHSRMGKHTISSTLYNPNNVGMYMSMFFPLVLTLYFLSKNKIQKISLAFFTCLIFANLLGSNARGAYIAVALAVAVLFTILRKHLRENWKSLVAITICLAFVFITMDYFGAGSISYRTKSILSGGLNQSQVQNWEPQFNNDAILSGRYKGIDIVSRNKSLLISDEQMTLKVIADEEKLGFYDSNNKKLELHTINGGKSWSFNDPDYKAFTLSLKDNRLNLGYDKEKGNHVSMSFLLINQQFLFINELSPLMKDIQINKKNIWIANDSSVISIELKENKPLCSNEQGQVLPVKEVTANTYIVNDERYPDYILRTNNDVLEIRKAGRHFKVRDTVEGFKFINHRGETVDLKLVESWGFAGKERMFSSRAYIWSRTIPLLRDTVLLGHGPDTFFIYFPQYDYIGNLLYLGSRYQLVDKPHNLYLQTAVNTGVLSLICFFAMLGYYLISSIRIYKRADFRTYYAVVGLGCMVAVIGYMVSGLCYDSNVSVAPVFWGLLGIGTACNHLYEKEQQEKSLSV